MAQDTTGAAGYTYKKGIRDGISIGLGYLSVAFTFGIAAAAQGLPIWVPIMISITNFTGTGQFAGLTLIGAGAPFVEMALAQLTINIRYSLMSLTLSQKLEQNVSLYHRFLVAFGNTDEIFAVACSQPCRLSPRYYYGLMTAPYLGWVGGTILGSVAGNLLPEALHSALGIAIYGMFIAIIIPPAKKIPAVRTVLFISAGLSCAMTFLPVFNRVSSGFAVILCAVIAAAIAAKLFPTQTAPADGTDPAPKEEA